jgi:asparagine synthase (glutamine-hydrolysing)
VFSLVNPRWLTDAVRQEPAAIGDATRHGLERTLDLAMWLDDYRPQIEIPSAPGRGRRAA